MPFVREMYKSKIFCIATANRNINKRANRRIVLGRGTSAAIFAALQPGKNVARPSGCPTTSDRPVSHSATWLLVELSEKISETSAFCVLAIVVYGLFVVSQQHGSHLVRSTHARINCEIGLLLLDRIPTVSKNGYCCFPIRSKAITLDRKMAIVVFPLDRRQSHWIEKWLLLFSH